MLRQRQHETPGTKKPELSASKAPSPSAYRTSSKTGVSTAMVGSDSLREPLLKADPRDAAPLSGRPPSPTSPPQPPSLAVQEDAAKMNMQNMSRKSQWIVLAVASGACAAFNGVFAKLYVYVIPPYDPFLHLPRSKKSQISQQSEPEVDGAKASNVIECFG